MPSTRSRGKPECLKAACAMASSGFETTIRIASGEVATTRVITSAMIFALVCSRSSRLMPGLRAIPAVMTTMSDPAESL